MLLRTLIPGLLLGLATACPAQLGFDDLAGPGPSPDGLVRTPPALEAGRHARSLTHGGRTRSYQVHIPKGDRPVRGWPTVIALHGLFMDGPGFGGMSRLHRLGAEKGFVTIYPTGTGLLEGAKSWNAVGCCLEAVRNGVDDVGFVGELLTEAVAELHADPGRLYLVGFSNGGMLIYEVLRRESARVAAVATVAAVSFVPRPAPTRKVPILHLHGTADPYVPFGGNLKRFRLGWPAMPPVRERLLRWSGSVGPLPEPRREVEDHVTHETWPAEHGRAEIQLYTIRGGGHSWPGGPDFAVDVLGKPDPAVKATEVIWEFLRRFELPAKES